MMTNKTLSHVIGIDDAPFTKITSTTVLIVGAVFAGERLDGVLSEKVRKDGVNATDKIITMIQNSRFYPQIQAVMLQGIAVAGFNVIDIKKLHQQLAVPVIVVCRKTPDFSQIKAALLKKVSGGQRKWRLIEQAGEMQKIADVYSQYIGIDREGVENLINRFAKNSAVPEPLRTAHIIAGGIVDGESRHRV